MGLGRGHPVISEIAIAIGLTAALDEVPLICKIKLMSGLSSGAKQPTTRLSCG